MFILVVEEYRDLREKNNLISSFKYDASYFYTDVLTNPSIHRKKTL